MHFPVHSLGLRRDWCFGYLHHRAIIRRLVDEQIGRFCFVVLAQIFFEQMDVDPGPYGERPKGYLTKSEFVKGLQVSCSLADVIDAAELEQWFEETDKSGNKAIR